MSEENKRLAILDELDKFNTAPIEQSGSIMEGILNEQEGMPSATAQEVPQEAAPETKRELPNDYLPLNSSIQELSKSLDERFSNFDRRLNDISQNYRYEQPQHQTQQQQTPYQYDPEAPVTMAQFSQVVQAFTSTNQAASEAKKEAAKTRGYVEFMRFKQDNPDFALNPLEIDATVEQAYKTGQPQIVVNANWQAHFENVYAKTRAAKLADSEKRISDLEKEIETLKKRPPAAPAAPVSPAIGKTTSRPSTIETPLAESDEITNLKSFSRKGNFKSFGNDVKRIKAIK